MSPPVVGWRINLGNLENQVNFRQRTTQMVHFSEDDPNSCNYQTSYVPTPPFRARSWYHWPLQRGQYSLPAVYSRERADEILPGLLYYEDACSLVSLSLSLSCPFVWMPVGCGTKMKKLFAHDGEIVSTLAQTKGGEAPKHAPQT